MNDNRSYDSPFQACMEIDTCENDIKSILCRIK